MAKLYIVTCGLAIEGDPTFEEWRAFGITLRERHRDTIWALGDWLNAGEHKYGEKYSQVLEDTGYAPEYIANVCWVCNKFQISYRYENLFYTHHQIVAALPTDVADLLLIRAEQENLSTRELRELVKSLKEGGEGTDSKPTKTTTKFGVFAVKQSGMGQALLTLSQEDSEVLKGLSAAHPGLTITLTVEYVEEPKVQGIEE